MTTCSTYIEVKNTYNYTERTCVYVHLLATKGDGKSKGHPITCHEGPEGEYPFFNPGAGWDGW